MYRVNLDISNMSRHLPWSIVYSSYSNTMYFRVNEPSKYEGRTALHIAALGGRHEVMDLLLDNEAKVDVTDIYGQVRQCM